MTDSKDPELVNDLSVNDGEDHIVDIPDYDGSQFDLPDDYEYTDELDGEEDGSSQ